MKPPEDMGLFSFDEVAPFAGAWVETETWERITERFTVAPFAGAWVETLLR